MIPRYTAFEGPDGTGKTTLSKAFAKAIGAEWTYEPHGDSPITKQLRSFCLDKKHYDEMNWRAREYLLLATRALSTEKVEKRIMNGINIVTDRSLVSGMVYAHVASKMKFNDWWELAKRAFWVTPELVVYVITDKTNIDVNEEDIYDNESDDFHSRIKKTFPDALSYLSHKTAFNAITFNNDFNLSPEENAKNLIGMIGVK